MVKYGCMLIIAKFIVKVKRGKDFFLKKVGKFAEYLACHGTAQRRRAQKGDRWLAKHFVQSAWCGQSMSDRSDRSDLSDDWHLAV